MTAGINPAEATRYRAEQPSSWAELQMLAVALANLKPADHDHFPTDKFVEIIDLGQSIQDIIGKTVEPQNRWTEKDQLPDGVTVHSLEDPEMARQMHEVAQVLIEMDDRETNQGYIADKLKVYGQNIDNVAELNSRDFHGTMTPDTYSMILLSGGARNQHRFNPDGRFLTVNAKRLDTKEKSGGEGTEANKKDKMLFGLGPWQEDISEVNNQHPDGIRLVVPDDCLATGGSALAGIYSLLEAGVKIREVVFYGTMGYQEGITLFMETLQSWGIKDVKVKVGDVIFGLNDKGYLNRVKGEQKPDGTKYQADTAAVQDMGVKFKALEELKLLTQKVAFWLKHSDQTEQDAFDEAWAMGFQKLGQAVVFKPLKQPEGQSIIRKRFGADILDAHVARNQAAFDAFVEQLSKN
ncbi:MAG TPA: hypothetical protein VD999_01220 [Vitreimonas sp.]|nr:hypothetical protein [Vitreimonas sp.]